MLIISLTYTIVDEKENNTIQYINGFSSLPPLLPSFLLIARSYHFVPLSFPYFHSIFDYEIRQDTIRRDTLRHDTLLLYSTLHPSAPTARNLSMGYKVSLLIAGAVAQRAAW